MLALQFPISNLRSADGVVRCALWQSEDGYPSDAQKAVAKTVATIKGTEAICEFVGLSAATYAMSAFHDENNDGKLNTNFFGIPTEGIAASNDAKGRFGPPHFADAKFVYPGGAAQFPVKMVYILGK